MRRIVEEYGQTIVYVAIGLVLIGVLVLYTVNHVPVEDKPEDATNITVVKDNTLAGMNPPTLELSRKVVLKVGATFEAKQYLVKATDSAGTDISDSLTVYDGEKVDTSKKGVYIVTYVLKDSNGLVAREELSVLVD